MLKNWYKTVERQKILDDARLRQTHYYFVANSLVCSMFMQCLVFDQEVVFFFILGTNAV